MPCRYLLLLLGMLEVDALLLDLGALLLQLVGVDPVGHITLLTM